MLLKYSAVYSRFLWLSVFLASSALALDPTQSTRNYIRTTFTVEDGLQDNVVNTIIQTHDGFLWIGTDAGLVRFNGRHFTPIDFRRKGSVSQLVKAVAEGPDGSLWVGTELDVVRIPDVEHYDPSGAAPQVYRTSTTGDEKLLCLRFMRDGNLFAGTSLGLYRLNGNGFINVLAGIGVQAIEEASDGRLLIVTNSDFSVEAVEDAAQGRLLLVANSGFLEWDHGRTIQHPGLAEALAPNSVVAGHKTAHDVFRHALKDRAGTTWLSSNWDLARQSRDVLYRFLPEKGKEARREIAVYEDGRGSVWQVRPDGVFRVGPQGLEPALTGVAPRCLLADSDGNFWVGTNGGGLIQFRDKPVRVFTAADGLPNNLPMTVLERHDGSIWVGNNCGGLSRFDGKRFAVYNEKNGLHNSCVWALAEDTDRNLWIGTWGGGVFRFKEGRFEQYSRLQGLRSNIVRSIAATPDGSLWLATDEALTRMRNGHLRNFTTADGLSSNDILAVHADGHGEILAATNAGVDRLGNDRFVPLSSAHQILNPHYVGFGETQTGELYTFSAPGGMSRVENKWLVDIGPNLNLLSMAHFGGQALWFSGSNGIFRFPDASGSLLSKDQSNPLDYSKFGRADGLNSTQCSIGSPNMTIDREGRVWVATVQGLAMIDSPKLPGERHNRSAVFIEEVAVDGQVQSLPHQIVIPPGDHHLEIAFDAIELTSPEKIHFQYRLDGVEGSWLDAGPSRTAVYTRVPLGVHWFHLRACNRDGVWDREGIGYSIVQTPFFYQTAWFRLLAIVLLVVLAAVVYRLRIRQIAAALNIRMEERSNERMRIARELHDTLLQSFQGLLLRFQAAHNLIPEQPKEAKNILAVALERGADALAEARESVENLRESPLFAANLARELGSVCEDLRASDKHQASAIIEAEGEARELHPLVRDEIFRIASEALRNAFEHADAHTIRVRIEYGDRGLHVQVIDDGKGIDSEIVSLGRRERHWGLFGMRERAESIGGRLDVWSAPGTGTKIVLQIPAARAYSNLPARRWRVFGRRAYERTDSNSGS